MIKMTDEQRKEIDELVKSMLFPTPDMEISEETKRLVEAYDIVDKAIKEGNFKLTEVFAFAKKSLGMQFSEYTISLKSAYSMYAVNSDTSDELYNKMDDSKTIRGFKIDEL